ncbi:MAG: anthranilate phosphoribosyltransferase [Candidatus Saganbacteria bacterium]|nr:anthranilate phosphoribosyltransferase [Candidatus Saganbacteria bacterium]
MLKDIIKKVTNLENLSQKDAANALNIIMTGKATPSQIACLITALRMKGETIDEITGFAKTMRKHAVTLHPKSKRVVDTCGTGGDLSHTFNISTVSALVAAGAGVIVAKHGNRSVSSKCGSADLLESLGVKIDLQPKKVEKCIDKIGIGFLFAPIFHKAMKYVMPSRKEIGMRTVFNILGPLTNPANAKAQVLGVYDPKLTAPLALVLKNLGVKHALVVHGNAGLDEMSISKSTRVSELKDGKIRNYTLYPEDVGLSRGKSSCLVCTTLKKNKEMALNILKGIEQGPPRKIVLLNAGAVIYVAGKAESIREGILKAAKSIDSGDAMAKLGELRNVN